MAFTLSHRTERGPSLWSHLLMCKATNILPSGHFGLPYPTSERDHIESALPTHNNIFISAWNHLLSLTVTHSLVIPLCRLSKFGVQAQPINVSAVYWLELLRTTCPAVKRAYSVHGYQTKTWLTWFPCECLISLRHMFLESHSRPLIKTGYLRAAEQAQGIKGLVEQS